MNEESRQFLDDYRLWSKKASVMYGCFERNGYVVVGTFLSMTIITWAFLPVNRNTVPVNTVKVTI